MKTLQEVLEYFNGRTEASMYVVATIVANRKLTSQQLLTIYNDFSRTTLEQADSSPEGQAYAKGYASLGEYLEKALKAEADASLMSSLPDQRGH
ncbi:hypothetical protein HGB07_05310 [Candidatus Roizmanbacteria bacterium]|nr:hypothetical protein [Candidatus Roizmanbacteria bacterium]